MTPGRRPLNYGNFEEIDADLDRLLEGHETVGAWTLGQICHHLATVTQRVLAAPADATPDLSLRLSDEDRERIFATRSLPEGLPLARGMEAPDDVEPRRGAEMLREALAAMAAAPGPLAPHRLLGPLTMERWREVVCIHCGHHLSFAVPAEGGAS
ncbi:DUF1569 domain-containing protein [Paludisphaera mucosa]|uniref:DUF1569 domain-containing protein n=1 Tax=Paludisphaera mucosa TaxID=3030827 RepID=A0ABT6F3L4_9BACT|nr:DUF1569 domain-containing protein [Paludisphaera mucosa]MDG3002160.1 DUF1569 domain-containing protein [Paludisphaera mucosa]